MEKNLLNMIGIGEFQKQAAAYLKKIKGHKQESILVSHNKPQAIVMSLERYEELRSLEVAKEQEINEVLDLVSAGNEEYDRGQTIKAKSMRHLLS